MMDQEQLKDQVSDVAAFKQKARAGTLIELPSGNKVRMRNPGMQLFMRRGLIPDSLTPIVRQALAGGGEPDDKELRKAMSNADVDEMLKLFDDVVVFCWVHPKVHPAPEAQDSRDDAKLYTDEIEFDDKVFTFQFAVGGVKDLEKFREQQEAMLERISTSKDMEGQA